MFGAVAPVQEREVQIVRKGSDKLREDARVVVVSYDLVAQKDTLPGGGPDGSLHGETTPHLGDR